MSRLNAKVRCNYYPLPLREAERIRNLLRFPIELFSALDPCVGDGAAFAAITRDSSARRYGIELDAYRAEQAGPSLTKIVQGNCLETHCAVESFSLCFCNPPYDWALAGNARERLETVFLNHIFRWLTPGGVLLLVIPAERATDCAQILASHFKRARVFRLSHPESVRYHQVSLPAFGGHAVSANNFVTARSARAVIASPRSDASTRACRSWQTRATTHTPCRPVGRPR